MKCSDLFYIPMWTIYHLQQRRYWTNSAQSQKYSILTKSDTLFWTHLVFVLCNLYVWRKLKSADLFYISIGTIYQLQPRICQVVSVYHYATQSRTNHQMPHLCAMKLVIVWYIGGIRSCSTLTSSIYPYGWYINSNLGYINCSKYTTMILIHEWVQIARQNRFFAFIVWYNCACECFSD